MKPGERDLAQARAWLAVALPRDAVWFARRVGKETCRIAVAVRSAHGPAREAVGSGETFHAAAVAVACKFWGTAP